MLFSSSPPLSSYFFFSPYPSLLSPLLFFPLPFSLSISSLQSFQSIQVCWDDLGSSDSIGGHLYSDNSRSAYDNNQGYSRGSSSSDHLHTLYQHEGLHAAVWAIHTFESDRQTAISSVSSDGTFRCTYVSSCYESGDSNHGDSKGKWGQHNSDNFPRSRSALDRWVLQSFKINRVQDTTKNNRDTAGAKDSSSNTVSGEKPWMASTITPSAAALGSSSSNVVLVSNSQNDVEINTNSTSDYINSGDTSNTAPSSNVGSLWSGPSAAVYVSPKCSLELHSNQLKRSQSGVALHAVDSTPLSFISSNVSSDIYENRCDSGEHIRGCDRYDNEYYHSANNSNSSRSSDQIRNTIDDNSHDYSTTRLFAYGGAAGLLRIHTMDIHEKILH